MYRVEVRAIVRLILRAARALVSRWREEPLPRHLRKTQNLIADELENELDVDGLADVRAARLVEDWRLYAESLRRYERRRDAMSPRLREASIEPGLIDAPERQAELFENAAAELRRAIDRGRLPTRRRKVTKTYLARIAQRARAR